MSCPEALACGTPGASAAACCERCRLLSPAGRRPGAPACLSSLCSAGKTAPPAPPPSRAAVPLVAAARPAAAAAGPAARRRQSTQSRGGHRSSTSHPFSTAGTAARTARAATTAHPSFSDRGGGPLNVADSLYVQPPCISHPLLSYPLLSLAVDSLHVRAAGGIAQRWKGTREAQQGVVEHVHGCSG